MAQIAEIIKYEGDNSTFIWKHPCEDFNTTTQLIVHESQEAITKLAEKIRFSDPMSSDALTEIETEIASRIKEIKTSNDKLAIIAVTSALVEERNKKTKILK